jgi:hypothetical protein
MPVKQSTFAWFEVQRWLAHVSEIPNEVSFCIFPREDEKFMSMNLLYIQLFITSLYFTKCYKHVYTFIFPIGEGSRKVTN